MYSPCTSAADQMRCSCPLVMSKPIYWDNLVGYQRCGGAYSIHHTGPAIPVHRSARFHRSHLHWHLWSEIWVDSILLVPIFLPPTGVSYACGLHQTHWLLSSHLNLLLQDIPVRRVVILPSSSGDQSCLSWAPAWPTHTNPRFFLLHSSILSFWNGRDSAYQL